MYRLILLVGFATALHAQSASPLSLQQTIPLPGVKGRIDHLSLDTVGRRLFVAALGNDSVEVIDLQAGKRVGSIPGLAEPQGVLYLPAANRLFVASGGDGSLRIFDGSTLRAIGQVRLGDDADNVRFDSRTNHIFVGYGAGSLAELSTDGAKLRDLRLDAHPESFQLEQTGSRIFVNLPDARSIATMDRKTGGRLANWNTGQASANFPMALDEADHRLFVAFRSPAELQVFDTESGKLMARFPTVGDSDDVFFDAKRKRIYAIGGQGRVFVHQMTAPDHFAKLAEISTRPGARTGYYSAELDLLFVAAREQGQDAAAIYVYRPD